MGARFNAADVFWRWRHMLERSSLTSMYPAMDVRAIFIIGDWYEVYHNGSVVAVAPMGTMWTWDEKEE
jgi:hypothetical protein